MTSRFSFKLGSSIEIKDSSNNGSSIPTRNIHAANSTAALIAMMAINGGSSSSTTLS